MLAAWRIGIRDNGDEVHISTGIVSPNGEFHVPMWGPWLLGDVIRFSIKKRHCQHPGCTFVEYESIDG